MWTATSKMNALADMDTVSMSFGFRGEALGSVSDVSVLEIVTKTYGMPNGYRKIMKARKLLLFKHYKKKSMMRFQ